MKKIRWEHLFKRTPSGIAIVLGNLFVIICALIFDWDLYPLVLFYWLENGVIGAINVIKMVTNQSGSGPYKIWLKILLTPFFCSHYFGFWVGHGIFVFSMFGKEGVLEGIQLPAAQDLLTIVIEQGLFWGLIGVVVSHLFSLISNYYSTGLYRDQTVFELMSGPYSRVIALHIFILLFGFILQTMGEPPGAIVLLAVMKTIADLVAHNAEHSKKTKEMRKLTAKAFEVSGDKPTAGVDRFAQLKPDYQRDEIAEKSAKRPMKIGCIAAFLIFAGVILIITLTEDSLPRPIRIGMLLTLLGSVVLAIASPIYATCRKVKCRRCHQEMKKIDTLCKSDDLTGLEKATHMMDSNIPPSKQQWCVCHRCKTYFLLLNRTNNQKPSEELLLE
jgi:hypothetical protein